MKYNSPAFKAGNKNLKGKLTKKLRCGCCIMYNFKHIEKKKRDLKEIKDFQS